MGTPSDTPFNVPYAVAPGDTLTETLTAQGISPEALAHITGLTRKIVDGIIDGQTPITPAIAQSLEDATGISAPFWTALETNYQTAQRTERSIHVIPRQNNIFIDTTAIITIHSTNPEYRNTDHLLTVFKTAFERLKVEQPDEYDEIVDQTVGDTNIGDIVSMGLSNTLCSLIDDVTLIDIEVANINVTHSWMYDTVLTS